MVVILAGAGQTARSLLVSRVTFHTQLLCQFIPQAVMSLEPCVARLAEECCGFLEPGDTQVRLFWSGAIWTNRDMAVRGNDESQESAAKHRCC